MNAQIKSVVPALPGWFVAIPVHAGDHLTIVRVDWEPVIAWFIDSFIDKTEDLKTCTTAITVSGDDCTYALKKPDGTMYAPNDRDFDTEEELIEYLNEFFKQNDKPQS